ncbi:MAG: 3-hydroxyacyl-ACP dehydratase FabZ family protein [Xanthobacteraceae bacterium]
MRFEYFQMIDRMVALDVAGRTVRSICTVPKTSTVFEGHFPNYPLMPGALLLECMAQTTGWLLIAVGGFNSMPFMAGVKEAKFRTAVFPGDQLEVEGRVVHEGSGYAVGEGKGRRNGKVVCEARIIYTIMPFPSPEFRTALFEWAERIDVPVKELTK